MQQSYPGIPGQISDWKGQHIVDFQTDLQFKVKETISEKWFYNHMKSADYGLPRIDMLNFLSRYAGYQNWDDFKLQLEGTKFRATDRSNRVFFVLPFLTVLLLSAFYLIANFYYTRDYSFCFFNKDTKESISTSIVEVSLLRENESPVTYLCDSTGCFSLRTKNRTIKFAVKAAYFKPDTITRRLSTFNRHENINLEIDDYAVMIHYFSNSKVEDWLKRRENLDQMISDSARIYQVTGGTVGMEIYNKWEFINKLTMPTSSLRGIEIIDSHYEGDEITRLRFIQNQEEE